MGDLSYNPYKVELWVPKWSYGNLTCNWQGGPCIVTSHLQPNLQLYS